MKNFKYHLLAILILGLVFYSGVAWGKYTSKPLSPDKGTRSFLQQLANPKEVFSGDPEAEKPKKVRFDIFWNVWKKVDLEYVDQKAVKNTQKRVYGAVKGMVAALGDPYSVFFDPEESKIFTTELDGKFTGIGAELTIKDGVLTVVAPIDGMPAQKAGLLAGDKIIKIDGKLTTNITLSEAVKKIRGEKGTKVVLTVLHKGAEKPEDIEIIRDEIDIRSVEYEKKDGDVAYVRIKGFMEDTADEFREVIPKILKDKPKGIILDVRSNPGGSLTVAEDIISKFVSKGEVILWERDKDGRETAHYARGKTLFNDLPVVVLIDGGSASASEILAGALRDIKQAVLVGEKTFGKGSVQAFERLKDGSSLKITVAKWLTPGKQSIDKVGIKPTVEVKLTLDDIKKRNDKQLQRALEELKKIIATKKTD